MNASKCGPLLKEEKVGSLWFGTALSARSEVKRSKNDRDSGDFFTTSAAEEAIKHPFSVTSLHWSLRVPPERAGAEAKRNVGVHLLWKALVP